MYHVSAHSSVLRLFIKKSPGREAQKKAAEGSNRSLDFNRADRVELRKTRQGYESVNGITIDKFIRDQTKSMRRG